MGSALIIVDIQNDFVEGGALPVPGGNDVAKKVSAFLDNPNRSGYDNVLATRDHHIDPGGHFSDQPDYVDSWPRHCVVGTDGVDFPPTLSFRDFDAIIDKGEYAAAYSAFEGTTQDGVALADWLQERRVTSVDIVGLATDYCVRATAISAQEAGWPTRVFTDLIAAIDAEKVPEIYADLNKRGIATEPASREP